MESDLMMSVGTKLAMYFLYQYIWYKKSVAI